MAEGLGRTVLFRHRYARVWGLGDRSSPSVRTPAFISTEDDEDACSNLLHFIVNNPHDTCPSSHIDTTLLHPNI